MQKRIILMGLVATAGCATPPSLPQETHSVTTPVLCERPSRARRGIELNEGFGKTVPASFQTSQPDEGNLDAALNQNAEESLAIHLNSFPELLSPSPVQLKQTIETEPLSPADSVTSLAEQGSLPDGVAMNLPSVLAAVGGKHPAVGAARWRVQEAYARLDAANVLWLPTIQAGLSFHRHDGNYQASNGDIVDVNRNSFQYGLGSSATGAGTTPQPGLVAQFRFADAIFEPKVAERAAWAQGHAAGAVLNRQLLDAAVAY
ncbi:MAG: hypothetical protein AAFV88_15435, partial [Planctomycetota bacterium]